MCCALPSSPFCFPLNTTDACHGLHVVQSGSKLRNNLHPDVARHAGQDGERAKHLLCFKGTFGWWISDPCVEGETGSETGRLANRSVEGGRSNRLISQGNFCASKKEVSC